MDRAAAKFDKYIRGVDQYRFDDRSVELPSGYCYAWGNANGDYVLSDNANFNPNVGGTLQWTALPREHLKEATSINRM